MNSTILNSLLLQNSNDATSSAGNLSMPEPPLSALDEFVQKYLGYFEISLNILYPIIFIFGICGNSLVIFVLCSSICINTNNKSNSNNNNNQTINKRNRGQANESSMKVLARKNSNNLAEIKSVQQRKQSTYDFVNNNSHHARTSFKATMRRFFREKFTVTNFYLLNLAISDFLYLTLIPILLCTMHYHKWLFGSYFCKIYFTITYLCQCSSIFILVVLSIDRYLSVVHPLKVSHYRTDQRARITILIGWILSFLFITPIPIFTQLQNETCSIVWPDMWHFTGNNTKFTEFIDKYLTPLHAFTIYTLLLNYIIPVSIIVILYTKILNSLNKKNRKNRLKLSEAKKKSHKRISKMVLIIIICYIISWTPYWCMQLTYYIYFILEINQPFILIILSHFSQLIAYLSSALNPAIYSYMSEVFRNELKMVLSNVCCCFNGCSFLTEKSNDSNNKIEHEQQRKQSCIVNNSFNKIENNNNNEKKLKQSKQSFSQPSQQPLLINYNNNTNNTTINDMIKSSNESLKNRLENIEYMDEVSDETVDPNSNNKSMELGSFKFKLELLNSNLNLKDQELIRNQLKKCNEQQLQKESSPLSRTSSIGPYKFKINFHGFKFNNLLNRASK
jgi:hypothetical protein